MHKMENKFTISKGSIDAPLVVCQTIVILLWKPSRFTGLVVHTPLGILFLFFLAFPIEYNAAAILIFGIGFLERDIDL